MTNSLKRQLTRPTWQALAFKKRKTFSAIVRVRNEEEFLYPAVASIIDYVEQVVLVDNLSNDRTPEIIRQLQREFPKKVESFSYPHEIARPGEENRQLISTPAGRRSPRLLSNYYNWCLARCREPFVIKWDGDTVATKHFYTALEIFRNSPKQSLEIGGVNVHPLRRHTVKQLDTIAISTGAPVHLAEGRARHVRPYEDYEPRVFPRLLARYISTRDIICESLWSPYTGDVFVMRYEPMTYLHFKHCKANSYTNISPEMIPIEEARWETGDPLDETMLECLSYWHLDAPTQLR